MTQLRWRRWSLHIRIAAVIIVMGIMSVTSVTLITLQRERSVFYSEMELQANLLLEVIQEVAATPLINLNADLLEELVEEFGESTAVLVHIYDQDGRLIADSSASHELVYSIHPNPFGLQLVAIDDQVFEWQPDYLQAGQPVIAGQQVVGAIGVLLPTTPLHAKMASVRTEGFWVGLGVVIIGSLLALFLSHTIIVPRKKLATATRRIVDGDLTYQIVLDSDDELATLATTFNQITADYRETIASLEKARNDAEKASRVKSQILANVSHDARSPLNVIYLYLHRLQKERLGPVTVKQHETFHKIEIAAGQLQRFFDNLVAATQDEPDLLQLNIIEFEPKDLQQSIAMLQPLAERKGLQLLYEIGPDVPSKLQGDLEYIHRILTNLVDNAIKFTEQGTIVVRIARHDHEHWAFTVTDTGVGIPADMQAQIFEPFQQVDGSITRGTNRGVGLGLAIVRQYTAAMGGQVTVKSDIGVGSSFIVVLPLA